MGRQRDPSRRPFKTVPSYSVQRVFQDTFRYKITVHQVKRRTGCLVRTRSTNSDLKSREDWTVGEIPWSKRGHHPLHRRRDVMRPPYSSSLFWSLPRVSETRVDSEILGRGSGGQPPPWPVRVAEYLSRVLQPEEVVP